MKVESLISHGPKIISINVIERFQDSSSLY